MFKVIIFVIVKFVTLLFLLPYMLLQGKETFIWQEDKRKNATGNKVAKTNTVRKQGSNDIRRNTKIIVVSRILKIFRLQMILCLEPCSVINKTVRNFYNVFCKYVFWKSEL